MAAVEIRNFYHLTQTHRTKQTVYLSVMQADMWRSVICRAIVDAEWETL